MNSEIRDQAYQFFIEEASELLQIIETGLLTLQEERSTAKVHEIMRAAHSIKGGAASVGLEGIRTISHRLEDFFKVLYQDEVILDAELEGLLLDGFDCLKEPLLEQIAEGSFDSEAAHAKANPIFQKLESHLGEFLGQVDDYIPSSNDLGIDIRASVFDVDVQQQLQQLEEAIASYPEHRLRETLRGTIEVFAGFAELLSLPSFTQVGEVTAQALAVSPQELKAIAQKALQNWHRDRTEVLSGNPSAVGQVDPELLDFTRQPSIPVLSDGIRDQAYGFFLEEAAELLQIIEQGLMSLRSEHSTAKIHEIMRAAHSIKGGAASVGLESIRTLSHRLEDYFKALHHDSVEIDSELEGLLLQGFNCLKNPLLEEIENGCHNKEEAVVSAQRIFGQIEGKLGEALNQKEEYIPSSSDLGIDIVASIFEIDVDQGVEAIAQALERGDTEEMTQVLTTNIEVFAGFAQLCSLDGFGEICQRVKEELTEKRLAIPRITQLALDNFRLAMAQVQGGDRTRGGELLPDWETTLLPNFPEDSELLDWDTLADAMTEVSPVHIPMTRENTPTLEDLFAEIPEEPLFDPMPSPEVVLQSETLEEVFGDFDLEVTPGRASLNDVFGILPMEDILGEFPAPTSPLEEALGELDTPQFTLDQPTLEEVFGANEQLEAEIKAIEQDFAELPLAELPPSPVVPVPVILPVPEITPPMAVEVREKPVGANSAKALSVRVDFNRLERMNNLVGELSISRNSLSLQNDQLQSAVRELVNRFAKFSGMSDKLRDLSDSILIAPQQHTQEGGSQSSLSDFDVLEMDSYGKVYSLLQGLMEEMLQLEESVDDIVLYARGSNQTLDQERQMVISLRDELMWARMLPLGEVLNRFPRVLRDLSASHNKQVRLKLLGTGVLVDKAALEKLYDPLLHLLRNAFDHGIESPETRASLGKNPEGLIEIRAYHQGNQTILEVKDDGGGLNFDKIRALAEKNGLITREMAPLISKERLGDLIFEPGFSTAEVVSELSGRGVGLDVVRDQLRSLKGSVSVASVAGVGTTFTLRLPLTLTIAKLLVCLVQGNSAIAMPSDSIEEIIIPQPDQIKTQGCQRFLHFAQQIIPIYPLRDLLEYRCPFPDTLPSKALAQVVPNPEDWGLPLLLLRQDQHLLALEVTRLVSEQELVIKPFGSAIAAPDYTYGCTILGDGTLIPVVNGITLLEQFIDVGKETDQEWTKIPPQEVNQPISISQAPTILVVDDSVALRRTLALTLEKAGYRVLQARDGRDALEQLQQSSVISMVICDVEMPNMNGFEFLGQRRREPNLLRIPVAMLTSRSSDKHRQLAMQLGANAYFTKPYIEQQFLASVASIIQPLTTPSLK